MLTWLLLFWLIRTCNTQVVATPGTSPFPYTTATGETIYPALIVQGDQINLGRQFAFDPRSGQLTDYSCQFYGGVCRPNPLLTIPKSPSSTSIYPLLPLGTLCEGTEPGLTCIWRTNWDLYTCHSTLPLCICPFNATQDIRRPQIIYHYTYIWPTNTSRTVFETYHPTWCVGPMEALPFPPGNPLDDVEALPCTEQPFASGRACRANIRQFAMDHNYDNYWPRPMGPSWMFNTFRNPGTGKPFEGLFRIGANARDIAPRCFGTAYFVLTHLATRELTATCDPNSASTFIVHQGIDPSAGDDGVALNVVDSNNVPLALHGNNVCWDFDALRECQTGYLWRFYEWAASLAILRLTNSDWPYDPVAIFFESV